MSDQLRRVTDLFVVGAPLPLCDGTHLWVQKPNSFEVEEARRDGVAARSLRLLELEKDDNTEVAAQRLEMRRLTDNQLAQAVVGQNGDELYLKVMNDLDADPDWVERLATIRRMPALLADENAPDDDPRRAQLIELNGAYLTEIQTRLDKAQSTAVADLDDLTRPELEDRYLHDWRQQISLSRFMDERAVTEIFFALRCCDAGPDLNHASCDHTRRLLDSRSQVRDLPDVLIQEARQVLDTIVVSQRDSGNSAAPGSSSASSEPSSAPEGPSTASTPSATSPAAPTT